MASPEILTRALLALALIGAGIGVYWFLNHILLARASKKFVGLGQLRAGIPAILYFTTPTCVPCKILQRPAIEIVRERLGDGIQVIEIDASERIDLAEDWGVMSVPTTFLIDRKGQPRKINHGVTLAEKLLAQIERISE